MPLLRAEGVSVRFGGVRALECVDLAVAEGEVLGVIGPNGAGKTTLFNVLCGALRPAAGLVTFRGRSIAGLGPSAVCRLGLARTFQIPRPFGRLTVFDNVLVAVLAERDAGGYRRTAGVPRRAAGVPRRIAGDILELTGLGPFRHREARTLTVAARKRLELARALATGPALLLLDETAAGLNPAEVETVLDVLDEVRCRGVTLVLVEHVIPVVSRLATRLVVLDQGRVLASGRPEAVLGDQRVLAAYLGSAGGVAPDGLASAVGAGKAGASP